MLPFCNHQGGSFIVGAGASGVKFEMPGAATGQTVVPPNEASSDSLAASVMGGSQVFLAELAGFRGHLGWGC